MSPSEFGFLAIGLVLGITVGAVLLVVVRPRSPLRPVVRVTITPNALTPRPGTDGRVAWHQHLDRPMLGSPDEEARLDLAGGLPAGAADGTVQWPSRTSDTRTRVPFAPPTLPMRTVGVPIVNAGQPAPGTMPSPRSAVAVAEPPTREVPMAIAAGQTGSLLTLDVGRTRADVAVRPRPPGAAPRPSLAAVALAIPVLAEAAPPEGSAGDAPGGTAGVPSPAAADPCAEDRAIATDACAAADAARSASRALADQLREATRAQQDLEARVEEASTLADLRRVAAEKERLHARFRAAQGPNTSADEAEAAAREWLTDVSTLNTTARDAANRARAGSEELRSMAAGLEQLDLQANAARIAAERSETACRAARELLASCEERQRAVPPEATDDPREGHWPGSAEHAFDRRAPEPVDRARLPVILRVLHGDAAAREQLVAGLAGGDPAAMAAWHVRIAQFVDAVVARAIEDGYLEVPEDQPFWQLFSREEQQEIVQALSSLGFRFDGMLGFADDRVPSARDLGLAVGYAGLDRMRVRTWPGESALAALYDGATVRADVWLATRADDLALARVEEALGPRAAALSEVWDAWGRVRPAMLEEC